MGDKGFKDHFSTGSAGYAAFRPTYPDALVDALAKICPGHELALDCGCGTGQLSVLLARRFGRVIATDASAAQIEAAEPHPGVEYRTALAEQSGLPAASVDLVTVAQAAHWLDLDAFYAEVRRVVRPGGALALITYGVTRLDDDAADRVVQHFYHDVIGPYWPPERRHVENGYRGLPFPFDAIAMPDLAIRAEWRLDQLVGYAGTWSAVKAAEKATGVSPISAFEAALAAAWGEMDARHAIRWPLSLRVGRV